MLCSNEVGTSTRQVIKAGVTAASLILTLSDSTHLQHRIMSPPADLTNIPKKHKAAVYDKPGTLSIKVTEIDTPEPAQGEVLVRLTHSGVCHSDYGVMMNAWKALPAPTPEGQVGGHEGESKA
jgi:hypothetical protein